VGVARDGNAIGAFSHSRLNRFARDFQGMPDQAAFPGEHPNKPSSRRKPGSSDSATS
jgi:hypothetical protein